MESRTHRQLCADGAAHGRRVRRATFPRVAVPLGTARTDASPQGTEDHLTPIALDRLEKGRTMVRRSALAAVFALASLLLFDAGIASGAELLESTPQQVSRVQALPAGLETRDEIRIDMTSGVVTRAPLGARRGGEASVTGAPVDTVYSNTPLASGLVPGWSATPSPQIGDIIRLTRSGVLSSFRFAACHAGPGVLGSASYRIRFFDASTWPTRPVGYPSVLLASYDTPLIPLNLSSFQAIPIIADNLPFEPDLPRDVLFTIERIESVPALAIVASSHAPLGTPPTIGESGTLGFMCPGSSGSCGETAFAGLGNMEFGVVMKCQGESQVSPSALNVTVPLGGSGADTFTLSNPGCGPITYSTTTPFAVSVNPPGGTIPPGGSQVLGVTVAPGIVPLGFSGFGDVQIHTTNDALGPTRTVRVDYTVTGSLRRAAQGVCYATQGSAGSPPTLFKIDLATGAATAVGPTSGVLVPAMAIEPAGGRMFAGWTSNLVRVDAASGALAQVAGSPCASAMTFAPSGALLEMGCDSTLYLVSTSTGSQVSVGQVSPHMSGLAFDPTSGLLYGVRDNDAPFAPDQLYRIAYPGGATTLVGSLGLGLPVGDITFDEAGNLFGVVGGTGLNQLVSINKTTGQATVIGPTGVSGLSTLAYYRPTVNCRFASSVLGFSSEYTPTDYSAQQALGRPDTYPGYGGELEWLGSAPDSPSEYLHLGFSGAAPINFVNVYETFAPGAVRSVRVKNPDTGSFETVWSGTPAPAPPASRMFSVTFPVTPFPVSEVYLDIASDLVPDYNGIDAVSIGYRDLRAVSQWASSVVGFSSEFTPALWSAQQTLGPPNQFPTYALDIGTAWSSATPDGQREYLELAYANPTPISFVNVVETFAPGALDRVSVRNPGTGLFEQVWSGTAAPALPVARINTVSFPLTRFPVSQVRLEFDSPAVPSFNQIDAVGIGSCECAEGTLDSPPPSPVMAASGLEWARPNPFAASTSVGFSLAREGHVEMEVFNLLGQRVTRLVNGTLAAGRHDIRWDGRDGGGRPVENGIYYVRMKADGQSSTRKIIKLQ